MSGARRERFPEPDRRPRRPQEPRQRATSACYFFLRLPRFAGTLAPERRASDNPIAIACLRLLTLRPERPLRSVPRLRSCIARLTLLPAFLPYRAIRVSPIHRYPPCRSTKCARGQPTSALPTAATSSTI